MDENREKQIKIAIPTNDGKNIFTKMLGMAEKIYIYEVVGKKFRLIEKRNNPYENTMQHLKTLDVYELIKDCEIVISNMIGKKGIKRLEKRGIKLFFEKGKIEKALLKVIKEEFAKK